MAQTPQNHAPAPRRSGLAPVAILGIHLFGVVAIATGLGLVAIPGTAHLNTLLNAGQQSASIGQSLLFSGLFHLLLSALIWFGLAFVGESLWKRRNGGPAPTRVIRPARGSIYVEFLAIIPVFLLLLFGLIQLVLLNLGSALSHVASYEAARTAWVWEAELPEHQVSGTPTTGWGQPAVPQVTMNDVEDRIRIAASLVMTPIAAGDYSIDEGGDLTPEFEAMRHSMTGRFGMPPGDSSLGETEAQAMDAIANFNRDPSLRRSLDSSRIHIRAWRKFTFAYLSTEVLEVIQEPNRVGARIAYYQHMSMPFVDAVFGETDHPRGSRGGHYVRWEVEHAFPRQRHSANRTIPSG